MTLSLEQQIQYSAAKTSVTWRFAPQYLLKGTGNDRIDFLNRLTTNELAALVQGKGINTVLTSEKGRVLDVLSVIAFADHILVRGAQPNNVAVAAWLKKYAVMDDVRFRNVDDSYQIIGFHGPDSGEFLSQWLGSDPRELAIGAYLTVALEGTDAFVVRDYPTCELAYTLIVPVALEPVIQSNLEAFGTEVPQVSEEVYHILRVENGVPSVGAELSDAYNPLEAGLLHLVNFKKGCYIGQEVIARLDSYNKVKQRLCGLRADQLLSVGDDVFVDGSKVGQVTSVALSPALGPLALAYIRSEHSTVKTVVHVKHESQDVEASVALLPF